MDDKKIDELRRWATYGLSPGVSTEEVAAHHKSILSLIAEYEQQKQELEQLREIVHRLPRTKDGVPACPGQILFTEFGAERQIYCADRASEPGAIDNDPSSPIDELFSTKEAAESAAKKGA